MVRSQRAYDVSYAIEYTHKTFGVLRHVALEGSTSVVGRSTSRRKEPMKSNILGLQGKCALVVGGASGIGRATALLLADAGADVVVADLDGARASATQNEVASAGVRAFSVSGDVTDESGATAVVAESAETLGRIDVVINIVGMAAWADLLSVDVATWDTDIRRNLTHHLFVGRAAAVRMIAAGTGGRMAFVTSVSGLYGAPNHAAYGAAKAGAMALVRSMAQEWGPHGIRVNSVAPDMIATPRIAAGFAQRGIGDINSIAKADGMPLGRYGDPDEIAGALVFLVSDLATFITGQTLIVDGGTHAAFPHLGPNPVND
jgi:NAD(P)-dependent dehydrogenase (short-subunit alcohol dehydrogenase family)